MEPTMEPSSGPRSRGLVIGIIILVLIILVVALIWINLSNSKNQTYVSNENSSAQSSVTIPNPSPTTETTGQVASTSTSTTSLPANPKTVTVTYNGTGFSPKTVTINKGDTVKFINASTNRMWVASNPHPTHTDYPGFDEKAFAPQNSSYSFTFTKVGSWGYHNHANPSQGGTVIVH